MELECNKHVSMCILKTLDQYLQWMKEYLVLQYNYRSILDTHMLLLKWLIFIRFNSMKTKILLNILWSRFHKFGLLETVKQNKVWILILYRCFVHYPVFAILFQHTTSTSCHFVFCHIYFRWSKAPLNDLITYFYSKGAYCIFWSESYR